MRTAPFLGKGMAFPFRVDSATGGVVVTEGRIDGESVAIEYLGDKFTIREDLPAGNNHIAEAILHILSTRKGEHDTLPEFGSDVHYLLFEPNTEETQFEAAFYFEDSTKRWEHRVSIDRKTGVEWYVSNEGIDEGRLGCKVSPVFIGKQVPRNLVHPFVTPRQARAAEYPTGTLDGNGHDWASRYYGAESYVVGNEKYLRFRPPTPIPPAPDDEFYEVKPLDTWLLISHRVYGDIRHWHVIAECYVQDAAERGESRDVLDTCGDPEPGTMLRMPSRTRLLMELAA